MTERIESSMKKKHPMIPVIALSVLLLSSCGRRESSPVNSMPPDAADASASPVETDMAGSSQGTDNGQPQGGDSQVQETPEPKEGSFSLKKEYSDAERTVSILGLKEYKKIKTDKYVDKAPKGKKYLVLFLSVYNKGIENDYFNVNYLSAEVDGKKTENTFLFNEPEGYPTIFTNIEGGDTLEGFIVWEVPESWKKLKVSYRGWKDTDGLTLNAGLGKKDLKKPPHYEGDN